MGFAVVGFFVGLAAAGFEVVFGFRDAVGFEVDLGFAVVGILEGFGFEATGFNSDVGFAVVGTLVGFDFETTGFKVDLGLDVDGTLVGFDFEAAGFKVDLGFAVVGAFVGFDFEAAGFKVGFDLKSALGLVTGALVGLVEGTSVAAEVMGTSINSCKKRNEIARLHGLRMQVTT